MIRRQRTVSRTLKIVVGVLIAFWSLAPIYWGVVVSLSTPRGIQSVPPQLVPSPLTVDNYVKLFTQGARSSGNYSTAMLNSIIEAGGATLLTVVIALPAAYALARIKFRGAGFVLSLLLVLIAMPVYLVLIPLFQTAGNLGLIDTHLILILIYASGVVPFAILILRSHIAGLPPSLEEAARLDGAGTFAVLTRIIGPLVAPGIVAAAVFAFLTSWGQYLVPVVFANSAEIQPLTVLIPKFSTEFSQDLGLQAAAGIVALIPPVILVVVLQRYLISGLISGSSR